MSQTLATLVKIHRHEVDMTRRLIAEMESVRAVRVAMRDKLHADMAQQKAAAAADPVALTGLPNWLEAAINTDIALVEQLNQIDRQMEQARDELQRRFAELKKYELAHEADLAREAAERARLERIEMDEIAGRRAATKGDAST